MRNAAYETARNALIPEAERIAKERVNRECLPRRQETGADGVPFPWSYFNEYFHAATNQLAEGLE